jgi:epsilon-lactone hydrolase
MNINNGRTRTALLAVVAALLTLGLSSAAQADENESLSPQARSMLKLLGQIKQHGGEEPAPAASGALTIEAAQKQRATMSQLIDAPTKGLLKSLKVSVEDERIAGVPLKWLTPQAAAAQKDARIAIYIHGGGYVAGGPLDPTVVTLTHQTGLRTVSIDYRLAPEHPFPAGRDDCLAVYRELVRRFGAHNIVMYGGSAGGGMVLSTVLAARDAGLALPAALALLSPWSDLTRSGDSYYANEGRDPILNWPGLQASAQAYAAGKDPRLPGLSPVYADYGPGFLPTLITTGTRDLFLSNCVRLYRSLRRAGVNADLQVWEGMWHSFEGFTSMMPESKEALAVISAHLTAAADSSRVHKE